MCMYIEHLLLLCEHVCVVWVESGGSACCAGDLDPISFSKCAGSAWHALRLLSACYRLCWL